MSPQDKREVMDLIAQRAVTLPVKLPEFLTAMLPPAAPWRGHAVIVSDISIIAHSDGADWIRQDTGVAI